MNTTLKTLVSLFLVCVLIHFLNNKVGTYPPIAKFLDPFHGYISSNNNLKNDIFKIENQDSLEIVWDENGIPHIFAENQKDMYKAQGYVVANDRLWQMDFISRLHAGKLSEIIGFSEEVLKSDRFMRRLGIVDGAKASLSTIAKCINSQNDIFTDWDGLSECPVGYTKQINHEHVNVYNMLVAYSQGVNYYIQNLDWSTVPIEYKILDYYPEEWSPLKTCILLKAMSLDLSGRNTDLLYTSIATKYNDMAAKFLYPEMPYKNDPIISDYKSISSPSKLPENCDENFKYPDIAVNFNGLKMNNPGIGSNNWAIHKDFTKNNHSILANDPHLGLNLPNVWYVIQLSSPDINNPDKYLDVMGATIPGAPGVLSGFNNYIAWGETNGEDDVSDFYQIEIDPNNKNNYLYDGESIPFIIKEEKIIIRGDALSFPQIFIDTIKITRDHGPIIVDSSNLDMAEFNQGISSIYSNINLAFKWVAHQPTSEITAFYKMNHATNYSDFKNALEYYHCPIQNFVYADIKGNIAMHHNGKIPIRCESYNKHVLYGNSSQFVWDDFIPFDELPKELNPQRGFVSSANQYPISNEFDYYYLPGVYWPAHRARRINNMLYESTKDRVATIEDMKNIQNDNFNKYAQDILPYLLSQELRNKINNDSLLIRVYKSLDKWKDNPVHNANMFEPTIFDAWYEELNINVWGDLFIDENGNKNSDYYRVLPLYDRLLKVIESPDQYYWIDGDNNKIFWIDDETTPQIETVGDIIYISFITAINKIKEKFPNKDYDQWYYSDYRGTDIHHILPNSSFDAFSSLNIPTSGSRWSPNAMQNKFGPSWRYIVEMKEDSIYAIGIYPGGQSGNPNSKNYDNFIDKWAKGDYIDLNYTYFKDKSQLNGTRIILDEN